MCGLYPPQEKFASEINAGIYIFHIGDLISFIANVVLNGVLICISSLISTMLQKWKETMVRLCRSE